MVSVWAKDSQTKIECTSFIGETPMKVEQKKWKRKGKRNSDLDVSVNSCKGRWGMCGIE